jgi:hypothetical protein
MQFPVNGRRVADFISRIMWNVFVPASILFVVIELATDSREVKLKGQHK